MQYFDKGKNSEFFFVLSIIDIYITFPLGYEFNLDNKTEYDF